MKRLNHFQVRDVNEKLPIPLETTTAISFMANIMLICIRMLLEVVVRKLPFHEVKNIIKPIQYY